MEKHDAVKVSENISKEKAHKTGKVQFDLSGKVVNPPKLDLSKYLKKKQEEENE